MSGTERRLAAIMFTDMVGFTALTQSDEAQSLEVLGRHDRLLRPIFSRFHGREVKTIGDSFQVEFDSALDATNCSVEVQSFLHDYNISSRDEWKITLRIGVHLGDVVHKDGDVFGDAVNIASRLAPLAEPEGVCISEQVFDQVRNKVSQRLVKLEPRDLKGVRFPIDIYKVAMSWERVPATSPEGKNRVAVLPFANMSPDPNDEYFADGMTEELIGRLAQVKSLRVISRTSVMKYKGEKKGALDVGRELNAGSLIEGSVRKAGNRVRVNVQLIDGGTEEHLWSSHYDGSLDDIFAVQSEIAEKVAGELKVQLLASEKAAVEKRPTTDTAAYTDYLQGRQLLQKLGEPPLRDALGLFQRAVDRDPSFARAYAGMADCHILLAGRGYITIQDAIEKGREAARRAVDLDPGLAEAHYALAKVMYQADDDDGTTRELRRALELNPSLAEDHLFLADVSASQGDAGEMVWAAEKAYQLDPLSPPAIQWLGMAYFYVGRGEEAMEHWKKTLHLEPYRTYRCMFDYHVCKGDYLSAEEAVKQLEKLGPTMMITYLNRGYLAALTGDIRTANEMIAKLDPGKGLGVVSYAGFVHYALGDMDTFFECELRAADEHALKVAEFRLSPLFEKVRGDPRFGEVLRHSGLPYEPRS